MHDRECSIVNHVSEQGTHVASGSDRQDGLLCHAGYGHGDAKGRDVVRAPCEINAIVGSRTNLI